MDGEDGKIEAEASINRIVYKMKKVNFQLMGFFKKLFCQGLVTVLEVDLQKQAHLSFFLKILLVNRIFRTAFDNTSNINGYIWRCIIFDHWRCLA